MLEGLKVALVVCQNCKGEFSGFAASCPFCDAPTEEALPLGESSVSLNLTDGQRTIVGLSDLLSEIVTKASFRLFAPDWGTYALNRFNRNNATWAERKRDR